MAAPSLVGTQTSGVTDAGGAWSNTVTAAGWSGSGPSPGDVLILQVLQDGTTNGAVTFTTFSGVENIAGTDDAMTQITGPNADGSWQVGVAATGRQFLYIGRKIGINTDTVASGGNSTSEDLYMRWYFFAPVSTGTTLATVIENSTAGNATNSADTSSTCSDTAVTTLGVDRLACNFGAITDDLSGIAVFTGMTGGTWGDFQSYESSTGTDGTVFAEFATMASAGTIDGGSDTITSLGWGVVGFALIGTTIEGGAAEDPFTYVGGGYYPTQG